jgi:DNA polymerase-4
MIGHLDLDAFFAAVEMHRRPELRGRPVVVGGDPDGRGVVATASYAARRYGIRSAMSCAEARRRCPAAVFVRADIAHYREWSARVWGLVRGLVEAAEVVGLDEGYLQLPHDGARERAVAVKAAVADEVRLSCSIGVGTCKVVAKIASDVDKPGGVTVVPPGAEADFLAPLPIRALPGAGPRTQERLAGVRVLTVGALAALSEGALAQALPGAWGRDLRDRARGIDRREVSATPAERVSVSVERTFERDISDPAVLDARGREMAGRVAERLRAGGRAGRTVQVKLRYGDFATVTRARTLGAPTDDAQAIWSVAERLVADALTERPGPVRLLGVGVSGLVGAGQLRLFPAAASAPALSGSAEPGSDER